MSLQSPGFLANGNISPAVPVKLDASANKNYMVLQATAATDKMIGIAQDGTYQPPGVTGSDAFAAHQNQPIDVYGMGDQCLAIVDAGAGVTAGDYLTAAAAGVKTVAFTLGAGTIFTVGQTLETGAASELVRIIVKPVPLPGCTA